MTKKDYITIARGFIDTIRDINIQRGSANNSDIVTAGIDTAILFIGRELKRDNPKFDFQKFREYILKNY